MTTALNIIEGAARLLGVIRKSEALSADEAADGLVSLNNMIGSWSNESLLIYARAWESFSVSAAASYTIGTSQTLNTTRPVVIKEAFVRSGGVDYPMQIITDEQYNNINYKTVTSPFPEFLSYDNGYPTGTIRMYPQLSTSSELHLLSEKPLTGFALQTTAVDLPPGWNKALTYNLALELHPEYFGADSPPPPLVVKGATDSLRNITLAIAKNRPLKYDAPVAVRTNILSGWPL